MKRPYTYLFSSRGRGREQAQGMLLQLTWIPFLASSVGTIPQRQEGRLLAMMNARRHCRVDHDHFLYCVILLGNKRVGLTADACYIRIFWLLEYYILTSNSVLHIECLTYGPIMGILRLLYSLKPPPWGIHRPQRTRTPPAFVASMGERTHSHWLPFV